MRAELTQLEERLGELAEVRTRAERVRAAIESLERLNAAPSNEADGFVQLHTPHSDGSVHMQFLRNFGPTMSRGKTAQAKIFDTSEEPQLIKAAELTLRIARRPLHIRQIIELIFARGWYNGRDAEQVRTSLVPTLNRKSEKGETFFKEEGEAIYGLLAWKKSEQSHE